jgi:type IV secretion system protein TrbL
MSVCDVPAIAPLCSSIGEGAASLVSAPFDWLAQTSGQAAKWMFETVWSVFDSTTLVDVSRPEYVSVYNILFGVAVFIILIFFCLQLLTGLVRRDPTALARAGLGVAKSVIGSFVVLTLTGIALEIVDQLCIGIVQATGTTMDEMGGRIALLAAGLGGANAVLPEGGALVTIFLAGLAMSAAAILWFSLLIRKALLLVAVVMAPIALSGSTWDVTKGWVGKWASFVLALIVSKLMIVVVFLVATAQTSAPVDLDLASVSEPVAGIVLMFVAAFAPYMAYRLISFMGFDVYHSMAAEQEAKNALNRPVPIPNRPPGDGPKKILDGGDDDSQDKPTPSSSDPNPSVLDMGPSDAAGAAGGPPTSGPMGGATAETAGPSGGAAAGAGAEASGAGAAAGPVGAAVAVGAKLVKSAAAAGPKLGHSVTVEVDQHAGQASGAEQQATPTTSRPTPPSSPPPPVAPAPGSQSAPSRSASREKGDKS